MNFLTNTISGATKMVANVDDFVTNGLKPEFQSNDMCKMAARGQALTLGADLVDGTDDRVSNFIEDAVDLSLWKCQGGTATSYLGTRLVVFVGALVAALIIVHFIFKQKKTFTDQCLADIVVSFVLLTFILKKVVKIKAGGTCTINGKRVPNHKCNQGLEFLAAMFLSFTFLGIQSVLYPTESCTILKKMNRLISAVFIAIIVLAIFEVGVKFVQLQKIFKPEYAIIGSILKYIL